jgi:O-antigen/teichoic acid export membrane protein
MNQSIVRRSLIVTAVFVIGHLFHYALMFTANRILEPGTFGRFYAAISLLNVLITPATVLSFMLARHFTAISSAAGVGALVTELKMLIRQHGTAGLILVLIFAITLMFIASLFGADAFLLLMLIPSVALAVYLFEMARAALQGMLDFYSYSAAWITWRIGQYVLAVVAFLLAGAAWAGMAAILIATVATTLILLRVIYRRAGPTSNEVNRSIWTPFRLTTAAPFALQYGLFVLINNVDVLLAYVILSNDELGSYSASSLLPKAIVTATLPVSQVMLPVMSVASDEAPRPWTAVLKALAVSAFLSAAGAGILAAGGDVACNDEFGIRCCSPWLLALLSLGAIPLSISRVLVVAGLGLHSEHHIVPALASLVGFVLIVVIWVASPGMLALSYIGFCWLFMLGYGLAVSRDLVCRWGVGTEIPGASAKNDQFTSCPHPRR